MLGEQVRFDAAQLRRQLVPHVTSRKGSSAVPNRRLSADAGLVHDSTVLEPTDVEADRASTVFAALSDPARLQILAVLADAGRCVCDIRSAVPIAANLLSYHLRVLREARLVEASRRGRWIDYRLAPAAAGVVAGSLAAAGFAAAVEQPSGCADTCVEPRR